MDGFQSNSFGVSTSRAGNMDINAQMEKLTNETAALRNEIWGLKEIVTKQNETIIKLLKDQQKLINAKSKSGSLIKDEFASPPHVKRFPISTQQELDSIEMEINENNQDGIIFEAKTLLTPDGFRKNLLKILSQDIIIDYNIDGSHNKKKMSDYPQFLDILFQATNKEGWTRQLFMDDLRKGFRFAKSKHFRQISHLRKKSKTELSKYEDIEEVSVPFM